MNNNKYTVCEPGQPISAMKHIIIFTTFILALCGAPTRSKAQTGAQTQTQPASPTGSGDYIGTIAGPGLSLFFHITGDPHTGYKADWYSLQQHAFGLKCRTVTISQDSLLMETAGVRAFYKGKYSRAADSIAGLWEQGGKTYPLLLTRARRPQTPMAPFPYRTDSVEYDNATGAVHLGATLTRPLTGDNFPVAILITGSGQQDRDETLFGHRPFAIIADQLTRQGIAVLRVDDRGVGQSRGDLLNATSSDFADDVLAGIRYLRTRKDIDTTRIGLIGHSEGGLIAPIVYNRWPHLKFIILLAGPGVPGSEISLRQQTDPLLTIGRPAYTAYYPLIKEKMTILNDTYGQPDSLTLRELKAAFIRWKTSLPDSMATLLRVKNIAPEAYIYQETAELKPWIRYFYKTDPALFLQKVKCPVLALNGAKDTQVDPNQNIPAIKAALRSAGTPVETRIFPDLNHLFQHCQTGDAGEYAIIEESMSPEVLQVMVDWTRKICTL